MWRLAEWPSVKVVLRTTTLSIDGPAAIPNPGIVGLIAIHQWRNDGENTETEFLFKKLQASRLETRIRIKDPKNIRFVNRVALGEYIHALAEPKIRPAHLKGHTC